MEIQEFLRPSPIHSRTHSRTPTHFPVQMILVTERVLGSLRNLQTAFAAVPAAPETARSVRLSPLEVYKP